MESFYVLAAFVAGWLIAQVAKVVIAEIMARGKLKFGQVVELLMKSGGMPSGHTASFTAAAGTIGVVAGFDSAVFALAVCTAIIIIYDAMNVRYAVGVQGKVMNKLMAKGGVEHAGKTEIKVVEGHTLGQVIVGFLVGLAVVGVMALMVG